jgi:putative acyl-CoA dehydrogenase
MLGSSALMRMALAQALHHARHRRAFGKRLAEHALMQNVLADLAIEAEAALALSLRVARAVDRAPADRGEAAFARIATAIGKFWICKRTPAFVNEAQECLGGAGYVEESLLPRLYRQAPLNSIWEGSGNIQCLDVLRACSREPETRTALLDELEAARRPARGARRADCVPAPRPVRSRRCRSRRTLPRRARGVGIAGVVLLRAASPVAGCCSAGRGWKRARLGSDAAHDARFRFDHRSPLPG